VTLPAHFVIFFFGVLLRHLMPARH
jgi:hypothetical protein